MRFSEFDINTVLEFLRRSKDIPFKENKEYIENVFSNTHTGEDLNISKVSLLQNFLIFKLLHAVNVEEVEDILGVKIVDVKRFEFPAVSISDKWKNCLLEGKIVYTNKPLGKNCFLVNNDIVRACKTLKKLFNTENFILVFNSDKFIGTSFMLSVVVAHLFSEKLFKYFMFTGEVLSSGKINMVDSIPEKRKLAQMYGKKLVSPGQISCVEELKFWFGEDEILPVPFSVMIKKDNDNLNILEKAIKKDFSFFSLHNLKEFFDIAPNSISIVYSKFLSENPDEWQNLVNQIKERIKKLFLSKKLIELGKKIVVNFACSESIISFATGVLFGTKKKVVFYSYNRQDNSYIPLIETDNSLRSLKENEDIKLVEYNFHDSINNKGLLPVIFDMTPTARIEDDVKGFLHKKGINRFVTVKLNKAQIKDNIPKNTNIRQKIVNEIYNLLNLPEFKRSRKLWFFMNIPVDIAFGLGSAFQDTREISLFKFFPTNNDRYIEVLNVSSNGIKSIF